MLQHDLRRTSSKRYVSLINDTTFDDAGRIEPQLQVVDFIDVDLGGDHAGERAAIRVGACEQDDGAAWDAGDPNRSPGSGTIHNSPLRGQVGVLDDDVLGRDAVEPPHTSGDRMALARHEPCQCRQRGCLRAQSQFSHRCVGRDAGVERRLEEGRVAEDDSGARRSAFAHAIRIGRRSGKNHDEILAGWESIDPVAPVPCGDGARVVQHHVATAATHCRKHLNIGSRNAIWLGDAAGDARFAVRVSSTGDECSPWPIVTSRSRIDRRGV